MVRYDGTVRNSNRQLIQLRYGEDGMDGALMEFQQLPTIKPSNVNFERRFRFDCVNQRQLRNCFKEDIVRDLLTSSTAQTELEAEWQQLKEDREIIRTVFPTGNSKVQLLVYVHHLQLCWCACTHETHMHVITVILYTYMYMYMYLCKYIFVIFVHHRLFSQ